MSARAMGSAPRCCATLNFGSVGIPSSFSPDPREPARRRYRGLCCCRCGRPAVLLHQSMFDHDTASLSKDGRANCGGGSASYFRISASSTTSAPTRRGAAAARLARKSPTTGPKWSELLRWVGLGDRIDALAADPFRRRKAARRHRPRRDCAPAPAARRRADRQCRSRSRPTSCCGSSSNSINQGPPSSSPPRHRPDGRIRRPPAGPAPGAPACLRLNLSRPWPEPWDEFDAPPSLCAPCRALRRSCRKDPIAGRSLAVVVAIMTFLASLTTGAAMLVVSAASDRQSEVGREVTIQVRPAPGRNIDADVRVALISRAPHPALPKCGPSPRKIRPACGAMAGRRSCSR